MTLLCDDALRRRAVQAALGEIPFDRLLINARVVDMVTGELRDADVGLVGDLIASVHARGQFVAADTVDDLTGLLLSPGLIDTHVHVESSHLLPARYAHTVVAQGTTTIFWDPHELANVLGVAGVRYAIDSSRNLPLRVICAAPSSVPSTPGLECSGASIGGDEMQQMLSWPEVAGVAEVMDMTGVLQGSEKMQAILAAGRRSGKLIEGHARGMSGHALQAYLAAGVGSDHELTSGTDALEKLRAGLTLQIRGSHPYLLPEIVQALKTLPHLSSQITLCTDDVPPDTLLTAGGMIALVRLLVSHGLAAQDVLRMATLNAAIRLQRNDLGLIAAGRQADIVAFDSLTALQPQVVYSAGQRVAEQGCSLAKALTTPPAPALLDTMKLPPLSAADFVMKVPAVSCGWARLRTIKGARFTQWSELKVRVEQGKVLLPAQVSLIWVMHRHGRYPAKPQLALLEGWGELQGAIATSYSHDAHNLVVLGRDPQDMLLAANSLIRHGGGMAVTRKGELLAEVAMPIAGMLSDLPIERLAAQFSALREASGQVVEWQAPFRVFKAIEGTCLACNAGPHLTDLGLTDGSLRTLVDPLIACGEDS